MRIRNIVLGATAVAALGQNVQAQQGRGEQSPRVRSAPHAQVFSARISSRAIIGVQTSGGSARDTLGLLISAITPGGPAEQAGLLEGNRLQEVNGVSLRLTPADAGEPDMAGILHRRLERELAKVEPGEEVRLRVWADGRTREVRVRTEERQQTRSVVGRSGITIRRGAEQSDRAVIGVSLGSSGSVRDTLGVFIIGVESGGPAEAAGIYEGARIAEINGVNLRVSAVDAGDPQIGMAMANRLHRELSKVDTNDTVQLQVWSEGRYRTVSLRPVRAGDLYGDRQSMIYFGDRVAPMPPMPPMPPAPPRAGSRIRLELDEAANQRMEDAMRRAREMLERVSVQRVRRWEV